MQMVKSQEKNLNFQNLVTVENGEPITSSRTVAAIFEKSHAHVLRDIRNIMDDLTALEGMSKIGHTPYYTETLVQNPQNGEYYPVFNMTRDGFTLLAMGFTGSAALRWKIAYIEAFNEMERRLTASTAPTLPPLADRLKVARALINCPLRKVPEFKSLFPDYFPEAPAPGSLEYISDRNTSYRRWVEDCGIDAEWLGDFPTNDIFNNYVRFCVENRLDSVGKKTFYKMLEDDFYMTRKQRADGNRYFVRVTA